MHWRTNLATQVNSDILIVPWKIPITRSKEFIKMTLVERMLLRSSLRRPTSVIRKTHVLRIKNWSLRIISRNLLIQFLDIIFVRIEIIQGSLKYLRIENSDRSTDFLSSGWASRSKSPYDWGEMYRASKQAYTLFFIMVTFSWAWLVLICLTKFRLKWCFPHLLKVAPYCFFKCDFFHLFMQYSIQFRNFSKPLNNHLSHREQ